MLKLQKFKLRSILTFAGPLLLVSSVAAAQQVSNRIGPGDKVEIRVAELPDFNSEFQVDDDGMLELPHVGTLQAAGSTERDLADELRRRLESIGLRRATVTVRITEYSRPVAVLGAVVNPGNRSVAGRTTLLEVLLAAGGLTADRGRYIQVRRRASNGLSDQVSIPVDDLFDRGDPAVNIPIFAGDVIHVPPAKTIQIHFLGEVQGTGSVSFKSTERVTLLLAIARAGGLTNAASPKIRILRGQGSEKVEIVANYRHILAGKDPDVELQDGDIVVVKESFF